MARLGSKRKIKNSVFYVFISLFFCFYIALVAEGRGINSKLGYPLAVDAPITSGFGWRPDPFNGGSRHHDGVDFGAPMGTPVLAALAGKVTFSGDQGGYGLAIQLEHNNQLATLYAHLSKLVVQQGENVSKGQRIGYVGSTGRSTAPHLHFEVRKATSNGWVAINPGNDIGDIKIAQTPTQRILEYGIIPCDTALWGKCVAPPPCDKAFFGKCRP